MLYYFVGLAAMAGSIGFLVSSPAWAFFTLGAGIFILGLIDLIDSMRSTK